MKARRGEKIHPGRLGDVEVRLGSDVIKHGFDADKDTLLLCYTNAMRRKLNGMMRTGLGITEPQPVPGDRVVCLKNNFSQGVMNGMIGEVEQCDAVGQFYRLTVRMCDNGLVYRGMCQAKQFHEEDGARFIRGIDQWTWGYCLTVHKAQGSEADRVIVFQETQMKYMKPVERRRWLYTAVTRAKKSLTMYTPIYNN
jgi:exodeoxyribonuclease-5